VQVLHSFYASSRTFNISHAFVPPTVAVTNSQQSLVFWLTKCKSSGQVISINELKRKGTHANNNDITKVTAVFANNI